MVVKKKSFYKDLSRFIWNSRGRFFSVLTIIFLGVSFFAGINATEPDMVLSADKYFKEQHLSDFRIFSPLGFSDDDINDLNDVPGVKAVRMGYAKDVFFAASSGVSSTVKLMSYNSQGNVNIPYLTEGRCPEKSGEVLIEDTNGIRSQLEIGSKITASLPEEEDILADFATAEFTVVGFMHSPLYITYEHGQTNIGDGSIDYAAYIAAEDFKADSYNESYIRLQDTDQHLAYSSGYKEMIRQPQKKIEDIGREAMARETGALREELEEARHTFLENKLQAEAEIAAGEEELEAAEQAVIDGEAELEAQKERYTREIAAAKEELKSGQEKLEQGRLEYYDGYTSWLEGYNHYQDGRAELQAAKSELDDARVRLDAGERELESARSDLESAKAQLAYLETALTALREIEESLPEGSDMTEEEYEELLERIELIDPDLAELIESSYNYNDLAALRPTLQNAIADLEEQNEDAQRQIEEGEQQIAEGEKEIRENRKLYEEGLHDYQAGVQKLEESKKEIDKAKKELDAARAEIDKNSALLKQGEKEITASERELETALAEGYQKLEAGRVEVDKGKEIFRREKEEALEKIADAEAEIKEAERLLLELPKEWFVYSRDGNPGYSGYGDDANRVGAVAKVFPLFFFLVAALVCLTTMTRMIEEERTQIGTIKALGYGNLLIASKYLVYALMASLVGSVLGFTVGFQLFPRVIISIYGNMYMIPHLLSPFHPDYALLSAAIAVLTTVIAALAASFSTLKAAPAQLMQPKAPKPGKRIMLERLNFIWERLNFIQKVTVRNIFRYKKRFFMTAIGIAGCTALLLTGYGIRDSVNAIMGKQFDEIFIYDGMLRVNVNAAENINLEQIFAGEEKVTAYMAAMTESVSAYRPDSDRSFEVNLLVPEEESRLPQFFDLRERISAESLSLTQEGAVITEKLAKLLDVSVGDTLEYKDTDNRTYKFTVAGIAENYLVHYIFMSREYFDQVTLREPDYNTGIFNLDAEYDEQQLRENLLRKDEVVGITLAKSYQIEFNDVMSNLDYVVLILILAAGALAVVVLYNLTNINITERTREIATIKVLGFRDREVSSYVYRENIILALIGTLIGLGLGVVLHRFVIETMEVDNMMFGRNIAVISYFYAVLLTMFFSLLVNFIMYFKLKKIDMVESLKSVE